MQKAASSDQYDLAIIGGGINGCGIARDAAGRGLKTYLCDRADLASGTSSASTKLIHGGLRYLEHYEFRLVREALMEREVLWAIAPHIVWPLRFVLPYHSELRPAWLLRLGLFLYDHLGGRKRLPPTRTLNLRNDPAGQILKPEFTKGFEYSDCWVEDSRLVVLNARDAADRGATIAPRTACISAERNEDHWLVTLEDRSQIRARALVNAAGPWVADVASKVIRSNAPAAVRLVQGSHIVVPKLYDHPSCYIFQNADGRIFFLIPYERDFTLIGTTDLDFKGDPTGVSAGADEIEYLCRSTSAYLRKQVTPDMAVWSYSGVRSLFDDGSTAAQEATRDYVLKLDAPMDGPAGAPALLSVFGGKITTYRRLAESALAMLQPHLPPARGQQPGWTRLPALCPEATSRPTASNSSSPTPPPATASSPRPTLTPPAPRLRHPDRQPHRECDILQPTGPRLRRRPDRGGVAPPHPIRMGPHRPGRHLAPHQTRPTPFEAGGRRHRRRHAPHDPPTGHRPMSLVLDNIGLNTGSETIIHGVSLALDRGTMNVLLGPTLAGKTTLMRLMAGLDQPTNGRLLLDGQDVTGLHVRKRSVAMVYQQFVNYPNLTVFENIASPLRVARLPKAEVNARVQHAAELLRLENMLHRMPAQLSGGQQQRTAIARALVKRADLVLLDEPLANLDYKLREELREQLPPIFAESNAILVYATTEPTEALLLGGKTATLWQGRLNQHGPTSQVYRRPHNIAAARVFSDPPLNELQVEKSGASVTTRTGRGLPAIGALANLPDGPYRIGFRCDDVTVSSNTPPNKTSWPGHTNPSLPGQTQSSLPGQTQSSLPGQTQSSWPGSSGPPGEARSFGGTLIPTSITFPGTVSVTELSGSESFVHVDTGLGTWVCLVTGVHDWQPGARAEVSVDMRKAFAFDATGNFAAAPEMAASA